MELDLLQAEKIYLKKYCSDDAALDLSFSDNQNFFVTLWNIVAKNEPDFSRLTKKIFSQDTRYPSHNELFSLCLQRDAAQWYAKNQVHAYALPVDDFTFKQYQTQLDYCFLKCIDQALPFLQTIWQQASLQVKQVYKNHLSGLDMCLSTSLVLLVMISELRPFLPLQAIALEDVLLLAPTSVLRQLLLLLYGWMLCSGYLLQQYLHPAHAPKLNRPSRGMGGVYE